MPIPLTPLQVLKSTPELTKEGLGDAHLQQLLEDPIHDTVMEPLVRKALVEASFEHPLTAVLTQIYIQGCINGYKTALKG